MLTREDKKQLLDELEEEFKGLKEELGFESTLDGLDKHFFIRDMIISYGYVPNSFKSAVLHRIKERFYQHVSQIHRMLLPSPYSVMESAEHNMLSDEDKKELDLQMKRYVQKTVECGLALMREDKEDQARYIDDSLSLLKETFPVLLRYQEKTYKLWKEEINKVED